MGITTSTWPIWLCVNSRVATFNCWSVLYMFPYSGDSAVNVLKHIMHPTNKVYSAVLVRGGAGAFILLHRHGHRRGGYKESSVTSAWNISETIAVLLGICSNWNSCVYRLKMRPHSIWENISSSWEYLICWSFSVASQYLTWKGDPYISIWFEEYGHLWT